MYRKRMDHGMRICYACGGSKTYIYRGYENWFPNYDKDDNVLCGRCNGRYNMNPMLRKKWNAILNPINHPRRMVFKGKRISLPYNPRNGICSDCGGVKGVDFKRTNLHHEKYDESNPLANTVELCIRCHQRRHHGWRTYLEALSRKFSCSL